MQLLIVSNNTKNNFWEAEIKSLGISAINISVLSHLPNIDHIDLVAFDVNSVEEFNQLLSGFDYSKPHIVMSQEKNADLAVAALDSAADACFFLPFEEYKFRSIIDEFFASSTNRVICVSSYKGGVGVTTVATNLAYALSQANPNKRILIIDAGGFANHVSLMLNSPLEYSLSDISKKERRVDRSLLESILVWRSSNLAIAGFGVNVEAGFNITASFFANVIDLAKEIFDYTIIQTNSSSLDENSLLAIEKSNQLLMVSTLNLLSISNTKLYLDTMKNLQYPKEKIQIILNRAESESGDITESFVQKEMGINFYHALPNDWNLCMESLSLGQSVIETNAKASLSQAYINLAHKIIKDEIIHAESPKEDPLSLLNSLKKRFLS